eukprot:8569408-Pyramimonas_sp.AAC.1
MPAHHARRLVLGGRTRNREWYGNHLADKTAQSAVAHRRLPLEAMTWLTMSHTTVDGVAMWSCGLGDRWQRHNALYP